MLRKKSESENLNSSNALSEKPMKDALKRSLRIEIAST